jgi:hypothetical protein
MPQLETEADRLGQMGRGRGAKADRQGQMCRGRGAEADREWQRGEGQRQMGRS